MGNTAQKIYEPKGKKNLFCDIGAPPLRVFFE